MWLAYVYLLLLCVYDYDDMHCELDYNEGETCRASLSCPDIAGLISGLISRTVLTLNIAPDKVLLSSKKY